MQTLRKIVQTFSLLHVRLSLPELPCARKLCNAMTNNSTAYFLNDRLLLFVFARQGHRRLLWGLLLQRGWGGGGGGGERSVVRLMPGFPADSRVTRRAAFIRVITLPFHVTPGLKSHTTSDSPFFSLSDADTAHLQVCKMVLPVFSVNPFPADNDYCSF